MLKKSLLIAALLAVINCPQAGEASDGAVAAPQEDPHKSRDAVFRMCKKEADQKQLSGDARSSFIATCVKNTPR